MKPTTEINTTIDYRKIGVHLKEARKANSLSQAQVAASLRISVCAYGNLERGSQRINLTRLMQLCELLGVAPGSILADCTPRLVPYKDEESREVVGLYGEAAPESVLAAQPLNRSVQAASIPASSSP